MAMMTGDFELRNQRCTPRNPRKQELKKDWSNFTLAKFAYTYTGELGYDRLNGTRKIGPSYAKSAVYI